MSHSTTFTARDAKNHFGELLDAAQREPVHITKNGRKVGVLMSTQDYEVFEKLEDIVWVKRAAQMDVDKEYLTATDTDAYINSVLHADRSTG